MSEAQCNRYEPGWYCTREFNHHGPCRPKPRWWNIAGRLWERRNR